MVLRSSPRSAAVLCLGVVLASVAGVACNKGGSAAVGGGTVPITVDETGFKPSTVKFVKGSSASLVFTRTTDDTCATSVDFPQLGIKKELPKGKPVTIPIPTDKEQELSFQCGMGMYKSSVVVSAK